MIKWRVKIKFGYVDAMFDFPDVAVASTFCQDALLYFNPADSDKEELYVSMCPIKEEVTE